jgi:hypothetical protein
MALPRQKNEKENCLETRENRALVTSAASQSMESHSKIKWGTKLFLLEMH